MSVRYTARQSLGNCQLVGAVRNAKFRQRQQMDLAWRLPSVLDHRARRSEIMNVTINEQAAELRQILDFTPQLIAVYGPNRERLYVNRVGLDYLGLTLEAWLQTAAECQ